jgi:hypothetical protein
MNNDNNQPINPIVANGIAGAGGGTIIVALANMLPEGNNLRPVLLYLSPSISIAFLAIWVWAKLKIKNAIRDREVKNAYCTAKQYVDEASQNPQASKEHIKCLNEQLEKMQLILIKRQAAVVETLEVLTEKDLEKDLKK